MQIRLSFLSGFVLDGLPGWRETIALPVPERIKALADPAVRAASTSRRHSKEAGVLAASPIGSDSIIVEAFTPETPTLRRPPRSATSRSARGKTPFDALLDIVIADELRTGLRRNLRRRPKPTGRARADVWRDRGRSDRRLRRGRAPRHDVRCDLLDVRASATRRAQRLRHARRSGPPDHRRAGAAVRADGPRLHRSRLARRPRDVRPGDRRPRPERTRYDLPAGAPRLVADAKGITSVWVAGTEVCHDGAATGALPGTVLRSGRDTETVTAS